MLNIKSFAKINLGLEILSKRNDGYHEINTIFAVTDLHDNISITQSDKLEVECYPNLNIPSEENLVFKAAKIIRNYFSKELLGAKITINKNIPIGAGLGGGSSNAAAALIALIDYWKINISLKDLSSIGISLGSDVPFFIKSNSNDIDNKFSAIAKGRGEILNYFDYSLNFPLLLIYPNIHISTKWAYNSLNICNKKKIGIDFQNLLLNAEISDWRNNIINDFEKTVFKEFPEIENIKNDLYNYGSIFALMSGSGSCVYGIFKNNDDLLNAQKYFSKYQTFATNLNRV
jgi:4-diphosphocytidyl-2-C-methyl-D-erythritol kinase